MITRFRLEASGISHVDCRRQIDDAVERILAMDGSLRDDWVITDDVSYRDITAYRARVVMKRKGDNERSLATVGRRSDED